MLEKMEKIVKAIMNQIFFLYVYYYYYAYYYLSKVRAFFAAAVWKRRLRSRNVQKMIEQ